MGALRLAMRQPPLTVLALCLLSLGAPQPMGVTGLAVARLSPSLKWGDRGHLSLLWTWLECSAEGVNTF